MPLFGLGRVGTLIPAIGHYQAAKDQLGGNQPG